jgi:hypothetical protein
VQVNEVGKCSAFDEFVEDVAVWRVVARAE